MEIRKNTLVFLSKFLSTNQETGNANHVSSDEHVNVPVQFQWGDLRWEVFIQHIEVTYEETVKWSHKCFLPSGKTFVKELARTRRSSVGWCAAF